MTGIGGLIIVIPNSYSCRLLSVCSLPELISARFLLHSRPLFPCRGEWEGLQVRGREGTNWIRHAQEVTPTEPHQSITGACFWKLG